MVVKGCEWLCVTVAYQGGGRGAYEPGARAGQVGAPGVVVEEEQVGLGGVAHAPQHRGVERGQAAAAVAVVVVAAVVAPSLR